MERAGMRELTMSNLQGIASREHRYDQPFETDVLIMLVYTALFGVCVLFWGTIIWGAVIWL
jgi:hypothetical protein